MNKKFSLGVVVVGIALAIIPLVVGNSSNDVKELSPLYEIRAEQAAKELNGSAIYFADRYDPDESDVSTMTPISIGLSGCAGSVCLASGCGGSVCGGEGC